VQTNKLVEGGVEEQAKRCMENISSILKKAGASFETVVKVTIFLKSMGDYAKVNQVYQSYFKTGKFPARSCFRNSFNFVVPYAL
jgi:2-iminobutanoate/2-iminopropanoate deaminase